MADPITKPVSDRICTHMNDDHGEAVLMYAKAHGIENAIAAQMLTVEPQFMTLLVQTEDKTVPLQIPFDHELQDSEDAHQTLIAMVKTARTKLAK